MVQYWRQVGVTWLQYSSFCARLLRSSVKPEAKKKIGDRENIFFSISEWKQGAKNQASEYFMFINLPFFSSSNR